MHIEGVRRPVLSQTHTVWVSMDPLDPSNHLVAGASAEGPEGPGGASDPKFKISENRISNGTCISWCSGRPVTWHKCGLVRGLGCDWVSGRRGG